MDAAAVRRTQEALGRVIRRPPLSDRLLSRPPFRYLHDIVTEVIRVTGFLRGLYTDFELKSDNVKDKDAKISFLQKAIDAVVMVTGEPLSVKPERVVAGHEPEKTNEFLQAIGKCCLNKLSSDAAVKRVLAGERANAKGKPPSSKSHGEEGRESKPEEQKRHKDREPRGDTQIKDRSSSRGRKPKGDLKDSKEGEKESDKQKHNEDKKKDPGRDAFKEGEKQEMERNKSRTTKEGRETEINKGKGDIDREDDLDRDKGQEGEKKNEGGREKDRLKGRDKDKARDREREKDRDRGKDQEKDRDRGKDREKDRERSKDQEKDRDRGKDRERDKHRNREKDEEHPKEHGKDKAEKKFADSEESTLRKTLRPTKDSKCQPDSEIENPAGISRQPSTEGSRQRAKPGGEETVETRRMADRISEENVTKLQEKAELGLAVKQKEGEVENVAPEKPVVSGKCEVPNDLPPQTVRRRIPRPSSARSAPPRVKHRESPEVLLPERSGSGKPVSTVIVDQQVSDDDDDQFVVEVAPPLPEMPNTETGPEVELVEDDKLGGLVKRILDTKKSYESSQQSKTTEREKPFASDTARKKERDLVAKETGKCRDSIQKLCNSVLLLSRILDYVQEDVDAIKNEWQMWQHENRQLAEALQKEQSITDSVLEPLKAELAELEQTIKDQQDMIRAVKANILQKDEKIRTMILSINQSSRR
ncbi:TRAF3-interacting protein 1 isoform X2 [Phaenicophaeus curvirostris]|uniref:TRAF3-interacting protein 1 isoform X2 n=1 Tax=Phaenicophaeus curvirostris TaxID=33595 RepID=UPI0037F0FF1C